MDGDDRPYLRREEPNFLIWAGVVLALALAAGLGYFFLGGEPASTEKPAPPAAAPAPQAGAPAPQASQEPAIRHPLQPAPEPAKSLPALEMSDSMMRESIAKLIGRKAFDEFVLPIDLVRRVVATVDNLPRRTAPRRMMPLNAVPGRFATTTKGETSAIDPRNSARYAPYLRAMESVQAGALVQLYVGAYPLFQQAYEQLGYPGKYFNDRLVEAIDDMLAAPEIDAPIQLIRPKVLYEFADPDLETHSAGQKILLRMGKENALKVKAKLREVRQALAAVGERKP